MAEYPRVTDAEQKQADEDYVAKKERVRRGELCYYCMERKPTRTALHAADGAQLPACDDCFKVQQQLIRSRSNLNLGCLIVAVLLAAAAAKYCF